MMTILTIMAIMITACPGSATPHPPPPWLGGGFMDTKITIVIIAIKLF